jgi:hypothetical protein
MKSTLKRRIGLGIVLALVVWSGLWLREWIYPASEAYRFRWDMNNAWKQGIIILDAARARPDISKTSPTLGQVYHSYLTRYDAAIAASTDRRYQLDYPPGRLLLNCGFGLGEFDCRAGATSLLTTLGVGVSPGTTLLHIAAGFLALPPIGYHLLVVNQQTTL